jgi:tubulin monoglycylase TTLL3/8
MVSPEARGVIIHNHLQYNFYLGNKKALFYNLKEYYSLIGKNVFDYVPLTFHIRKGMKDPEYTRFVDYYKKRAKLIQK